MDREDLLEQIIEAIADYKDVGTEEIGSDMSFAELELEPVDVLSIGREVCQQFELEPRTGFEFTQTAEELVDFICS